MRNWLSVGQVKSPLAQLPRHRSAKLYQLHRITPLATPIEKRHDVPVCLTTDRLLPNALLGSGLAPHCYSPGRRPAFRPGWGLPSEVCVQVTTLGRSREGLFECRVHEGAICAGVTRQRLPTAVSAEAFTALEELPRSAGLEGKRAPCGC